MQEFLFQDSNFKLSGNQNILSIQASLDGFSILIRGADNPSSFYLHQYPFSQTTSSGLIRKLRELLEKEHPSDKAFEKVNISFTNNRFKLIPAVLFDEKLAHQLLQTHDKEEDVIANPIGEKYILAFAVEKSITDLFRYFLPQSDFLHEITLLSDSKLDSKENGIVDMTCHFGASHFYIITKKEHEIVFLNRFDVADKNDVLFYLISAVKLFEKDNLNIRLTGNILEKSDVYMLLKRYFQGILFYTNKNADTLEQKLNCRIHTLFPIITYLL